MMSLQNDWGHIASGAPILFLFVSCLVGFAAEAVEPAREVAYMPTAPYPRSEVFDHGYRAWVSSGITEPYGREVEVHDRVGRRLYSRSIPVPDGGVMRIIDIAVSSSGLLAAVGPWNDSNDTGTMSRGLVLLDQQGEPILSVDTHPFLPEAVCFGSDGGIWLFGVDSPSRAEGFDVLRKYNIRGELVCSTLPSESLPEGLIHPREARFHRFFGFAGSRYGLLTREGLTWFDLSPQGELLGSTELPPAPAGPVARLALAASGELYAGVGDQIFRLNRTEADWQRMEINPGVPCGPLDLAGTDGPDIVLAERHGYPSRLFRFAESALLEAADERRGDRIKACRPLPNCRSWPCPRGAMPAKPFERLH